MRDVRASAPISLNLAIGVVDVEPGSSVKEIVGLWLIPFAAAMAVISLLIGQRLGRLFIRLMLKRPRSGGAI